MARAEHAEDPDGAEEPEDEAEGAQGEAAAADAAAQQLAVATAAVAEQIAQPAGEQQLLPILHQALSIAERAQNLGEDISATLKSRPNLEAALVDATTAAVTTAMQQFLDLVDRHAEALNSAAGSTPNAEALTSADGSAPAAATVVVCHRRPKKKEKKKRRKRRKRKRKKNQKEREAC